MTTKERLEQLEASHIHLMTEFEVAMRENEKAWQRNQEAWERNQKSWDRHDEWLRESTRRGAELDKRIADLSAESDSSFETRRNRIPALTEPI